MAGNVTVGVDAGHADDRRRCRRGARCRRPADRLGQADHLERVVGAAPAGERLHLPRSGRRRSGRRRRWRRTARPCLRFSSTGSMAMMRAAPAMRAPWITAWPTPPHPMTATIEPGSTCAVLSAAPTPVVTPQPMSASCSSGRSVLDLHHRVLRRPSSPRRTCRGRSSPMTCVAVGARGRAARTSPSSVSRTGSTGRAGRTSTSPHGGDERGDRRGRRPARAVTSSPTFSTTPVPSWPRITGGRQGSAPLMHREVGVAHAAGGRRGRSRRRGPGSTGSTSSIDERLVLFEAHGGLHGPLLVGELDAGRACGAHRKLPRYLPGDDPHPARPSRPVDLERRRSVAGPGRPAAQRRSASSRRSPPPSACDGDASTRSTRPTSCGPATPPSSSPAPLGLDVRRRRTAARAPRRGVAGLHPRRDRRRLARVPRVGRPPDGLRARRVGARPRARRARRHRRRRTTATCSSSPTAGSCAPSSATSGATPTA